MVGGIGGVDRVAFPAIVGIRLSRRGDAFTSRRQASLQVYSDAENRRCNKENLLKTEPQSSAASVVFTLPV